MVKGDKKRKGASKDAEEEPKKKTKVVLKDIGPPTKPTPESVQETELLSQNAEKIDVDPEVVTQLTKDSLALVYEGFVPGKIRSAFIGKSDLADDPVSIDVARILIKCLIAYSNVGNNLRKITDKVSDVAQATALLASITTAGIGETSENPNSITLPRLAIAFMPVYLAVRFCNRPILQNQTSSKIDVVYKDVAFCGHKGIYTMAGYKEFYYEFSRMIDSREDEAVAESKFEDMDERWADVAQKGFEKDKAMHGLVDLAIKKGGYTMKEVILFAVTVLRKHKMEEDRVELGFPDEEMSEGEVAE